MSRSLLLSIAFASSLLACRGESMAAQTPREPTGSGQTLIGQRIVMLRGMGEVRRADDHARPRSSVGINIVSPVVRVEGRRLWVLSTSGDDSGWVDSAAVLRLSDATPYFTALIERDSSDWDAYLRRAEVEHALNQQGVATADYTQAIRLHPGEAFLYLRRGRHYNTLRACANALSDFQGGIAVAPTSAPQGYNLVAELYSLESGIYASCPDSTRRDRKRAVEAILHAIALDSTRAIFWVVLASAYASSGNWRGAVGAQRRALASTRAAPSYRADWQRRLEEYERAAVASSSAH